MIAFYSKKSVPKPYKVYGNDKGKAKHRLNFKKNLKVYQSLNKNGYEF